MKDRAIPQLRDILGKPSPLANTRLQGQSPLGRLPLDPTTLQQSPSGTIFGMTQNAGMGWDPAALNQDQYLILSTLGGLRRPDGTPEALGYHTGHWELDGLVRTAADTFRSQSAIPFSAYCTDPCDGRSQGTPGMMDSLPYRNDAAIVMRRLVRSLPSRRGVLGVATCDKGLPAMLLALAGCPDLPSVVVPGGVTLPAEGAEDLGTVQTLGARFAHGMITLEYAAEMGCRACGSPGGGCQFLGTAATSQVVAEALGLTLPHAALVPSGEPPWFDLARRSVLALLRLQARQSKLSDVLTAASFENAMVVHAAFGGSTNLLLHIPAIAHAAGLPIPKVDDWIRVNRLVPRLVDALPNGPKNFPTAWVYMAGGVPEVMLHLRASGLLNLDAATVSGESVNVVLDWWAESPTRSEARKRLKDITGVDPAEVIMDPATATRKGFTGTLVFPKGNLAPQGSVVKATAIAPEVAIEGKRYLHRGRVRVFTSEADAIRAIKGIGPIPVKAGDILALIGIGPSGTGMEEIYQVTSALKFIPWGKQVTVLTDGRFSGVSTGPCVGHIGPEALDGGPIGKLRDNDLVEVEINRETLEGSINLVGDADHEMTPVEANILLERRTSHPGLAPHPNLPADTRLWAALQSVSGGTWAGAVYDAERIIEALQRAGIADGASSD